MKLQAMLTPGNEKNYQGYTVLEWFVDMTCNMNTWTWCQFKPSRYILIKEDIAFICNMQEIYSLT